MFRRREKAPRHEHDFGSWKSFQKMVSIGSGEPYPTGEITMKQRECRTCPHVEKRYY